MSPRNKILRKVSAPPPIKGFRPFGGDTPGTSQSESIVLSFEEYEAMRLCDYEMHNHYSASVAMGVSRPTFTRIYASVRKKVARAFVEAKKISIEGGKVYYDSDWYTCSGCQCIFNNPDMDRAVEYCPLCGSKSVDQLLADDQSREKRHSNCRDTCVCPECGYEQAHRHGRPCNRQTCPECHTLMKRKHNINC